MVNLVYKFFPECLKNMPEAKVRGPSKKLKAKTRAVSKFKDMVNFLSPSKHKRTPTKNASSISHTMLFRSGSADWTSNPKIL